MVRQSSRTNQRWYKRLKLLELAVAAVLPVVAGLGSPVWVTGGLAAVIVILEGAQHLYQLQEHWISYRTTAEALKHERYLYLARGRPLHRGGSSSAAGRARRGADLPGARQVGDQQSAANRTAPRAAVSLSRSPRR